MTERIELLSIGLDDALALPLDALGDAGCVVEQVETVAECLRRLDQRDYDLFLIGDLVTVPLEQILEEALRRRPRLGVVVLASRPDYAAAVRLARCGAAGYIPALGEDRSSPGHLIECLRTVCGDRLLATPPPEDTASSCCELVGKGRAIRDVIQVIQLIAPRQSTVLISGRTGTGKELVARAIHGASPRASRPLVMVNCGAVPESLMEAEFFGHVKGAFTGAVNHRIGRFEQAQGGTIFLDEVGELPLEMQSKLLRVLQEREFQRVGSSETIRVDIRVIAATNRDLKALVQRGEFREDLYYRLNVVPISLPSLAERVEDLPLLVGHLLARICRRENLAIRRAGPEALRRLMEYSWPGNVRQLENAMEKAVALSGDRAVLYPSDFPLPSSPLLAPSTLVPDVRLPPSGLDFGSIMTQFEWSLLDQALRLSGGNKKRAADLLRIKRTTFAAKWRTLQTEDSG
jgi:DNA-binding NtrC family response regulator